MRESRWPSATIMFDRQKTRAANPKDGAWMQGEASWALQALSIARIVFYSIDCATGFMLRSDNCTDILGVPPAGPAASWSLVIFPEDRAQYELARRSLSPKQPGFEIEYRVENSKTGKQFWALDRGAGEFDEQG